MQKHFPISLWRWFGNPCTTEGIAGMVLQTYNSEKMLHLDLESEIVDRLIIAVCPRGMHSKQIHP